MTRAILFASVIVVAAAAAGVSMRVCAADSATGGIAGRWQAGTHYTLVPRPELPDAGRGKVEVDEIFWYGCGHCYRLDPTLESWKKTKPAYVEFVRIPVIWGPVHRQHARLFYTLQALGRADLHTVVFDTIHQEGHMLAAGTDEEARAQQRAFFMQHGVSEKAFDDAYDSVAVAVNVAHAEQVTRNFQVASVPVLIVGGKYQTSVSQAGSAEQLVALVNDLAASERRR